MSKRAVASGFLVTIIITLVGFGAVAGVIISVTDGTDELQKELICQQSIEKRMNTALLLQGQGASSNLIKSEIKAVPYVCPTIRKTIEGNREQIKKQLADKIARCWWMMGEGRGQEIFHGSSIGLLPQLFPSNTKNKCHNCYIMAVGDMDLSFAEAQEISADEMLDFLFTTEYKSNQTYLEYIQYAHNGMQGAGGPGRFIYSATEPGTDQAQAIKNKHAYVISFMPKNKAIGQSEFWIGTGKVVGSIAGAVALGALTGGAGWVGIGVKLLASAGLSAGGISGIADIKSAMYTEREVSSIYFGSLDDQKFCGSDFEQAPDVE